MTVSRLCSNRRSTRRAQSRGRPDLFGAPKTEVGSGRPNLSKTGGTLGLPVVQR